MEPVVIAITGASGGPYALGLLRFLVGNRVPVHLTISSAGAQVLKHECQLAIDLAAPDLTLLVDGQDAGLVTYHDQKDFMAPIASGSFRTQGMVVVPCSGSTLGGVATGTGRNLIHRAADVHLKEKRPLILVTRETPLSLIHINNMKQVTEAGGTILPAMPGWYHGVNQLQDLVDFVVARILDQLGIENDLIDRWG